ncbi:hypothetical protein KC973_02365 [Candidatus Saccharibacteria bacterium]|nr:hypothetical protein [Candidatus Saccharibacteria bacterium]
MSITNNAIESAQRHISQDPELRDNITLDDRTGRAQQVILDGQLASRVVKTTIEGEVPDYVDRESRQFELSDYQDGDGGVRVLADHVKGSRVVKISPRSGDKAA